VVVEGFRPGVMARLGLDEQTDGPISDPTYARFLQLLCGAGL
jgi:hypothetical protein